MRRFLGILLLFTTLSSFAFTMDDLMLTTESGVMKETSGVAETNGALKNLTSKKIELESIISLERNRILDEEKRRDDLQQNLTTIEEGLQTWTDIGEKMEKDTSYSIFSSATDEIEKIIDERDGIQKDVVALFIGMANLLDAGPFGEDVSIADIQRHYPSLKKIAHTTLRSYDADLKNAEKTREEFISKKEKELEQISLDLERAKYVKQTQLSKAITKILIYIGIFLGLFLIRYMSGRILSRFQEDFSRPHKEAMWLIHRWSFRAIFLIAFLVLFSSEFSAFLPFIAIVATAIGFALRDVVYSFIGWFMIGANDGYQEGDVIQIEESQGKVYKITPLLTTIEEHGVQGVTGRMVSFPNKIIFEKTITNFSRSHGFTFTSIDFTVTHDSDIDRAREVLMGVIGQQDLTLYYNSRKVLNKLRYTYGYDDADIHPRIDIIVETPGIILRAKVFVHIDNVLDMRTKISEEFCKKILHEPHVQLQKN